MLKIYEYLFGEEENNYYSAIKEEKNMSMNNSLDSYYGVRRKPFIKRAYYSL